MAQKIKLSGSEKFDNYYFEIYKDRWTNIKESFKQDTNPVLLSDKLIQPYYLDKASIIAASLLPVDNATKILDMCAAPGGKTLVTALRMKSDAYLVSNDRSAARRNRLINVINSSLTGDIIARIKVTGYDSSQWSLHEKDMYDSILLDAPCSSERHVFNDNSALEIWGTGRPKQLATLQFAMLAAALDAVKIGGYILYSTCSINPMENSEIIEKLYKKRQNRFEETDTSKLSEDVLNLSEQLEHGRIIMPDRSDGLGPLFFCLIRRI